ncbi:MAG: DNA polymerase I [Clostridia bacterium]|nr:DNA polymerase I [Clostridia bacterium]
MKFIVFDGNSILNRAYYGIRPLTTKSGIPTNAVLGFINIIEKNMAAVQPDYAAIAFDLPKKTFRHKAVDSYKATRKGMPEDLAQQMPYAYRAAAGLGLKITTCEGFEADDVLGTLSTTAKKEGVECVIVTGDRDSLQLVGGGTVVYLASTNETQIMDTEAVTAKYGIPPEKLIDLKALMGDSSDNIKGVPGIGEKGAVKLLKEYGTLDGIYEHAAEISGSTGKKIIDGKDSAYESKFLATIRLDAPIDTDLEGYVYSGKDPDGLIELFTELEFTSLIERMALTPTAKELPEVTFTEGDADTLDKEKKIYVELREDKLYATDGEKFIILNPEEIKDLKNVYAWSVKDTMHALDKIGVEYSDFAGDVSLMCYVSSPADSGVTLQKAATAYLGADTVPDTLACLPKIAEEAYKVLEAQEQVALYEETELPLAKVLYNMEKRGFSVDEKGITDFGILLSKSIKELESSIYFCAGEEFNINSPKQLGHILFEVLGLPAPKNKKNKNGYSTDAEVLEKLRDRHEIVDYILHYRTLAKLKGTYTDGMLAVIDPSDGRIHTTFRQTLTQTGRLSSVEPNLQNIPVRTELGREMRRFFIAPEGMTLIDADYSQIELRVLAAVSGDEKLIQAFISGEDIHTLTASEVFGIPVNMVTPAMRKHAKAVNFGIVYGISAFSLADDIGVTRKEASEYINTYFARYPKIKEYLDSCKENAKEAGYVTTLFGRRRNIPELRSPKANLRAFGERVAMNTPIQGTAADIIKIAMVKTEKALSQSGLDARLILQVHDELIVEAKESDAQKAMEILVSCMEKACDLKVPMSVDAHIGKNWFEAKGE